MPIKASDLMSKKLITVRIDTSLNEAANLMEKSGIRHLPVENSQGDIVGVLSARDFPSSIDHWDNYVEFYMNAPLISANQDTTLKAAVYRMLENKISSLVIVDSAGKAVGILTTEDLLWYMVNGLEKESSDDPVIFKRLLEIPTLGQVAYQISLAGL